MLIANVRASSETEAMLETVLEVEPEWRETLYIECVELVTGRKELAGRRRSGGSPRRSSLGRAGWAGSTSWTEAPTTGGLRR
jgi:hypothetical protein